MQESLAEKRLLILDVDNTLLHVPILNTMAGIMSGGKVSMQEFYGNLPEGGISVEAGSLLKIYPRPHLLPFLDGAQALGYDLALCTTATEQYVNVMLPACGVSLDRFVAVICRDQLPTRGDGRVKDVRQFTELGYTPENIVAIDDSREVYLQPDCVIQINLYNVHSESFAADNELLIMLQRLTYLGNQSLINVREQYWFNVRREGQIRKLVLTAFNENKYKTLPFRPNIFGTMCVDIEQYPRIIPPIELSLKKFLIYQDHGLVGGIEKRGSTVRIINYCPDVWTDIPSGISGMSLTIDNINRILLPSERLKLQETCRFMGYTVSENDALTLAAVSLQPLNYKKLHVLALYESLFDDDPGLFDI